VRVRRQEFARFDRVLALGILVLVIITGHLGGSLTHGSDYLSFGSSRGAVAEVDSPIVDVQMARAYAEVVRPVLRDNCYSCHGATRQKGGLRLDDTVLMMKGGKDGVVIRPGQGGGSELIKRLLLPLEDEHHMPPKEKKQLNDRQVLLLHWWIDQGADKSRRVAELKQPDSVRPALLSMQGAKPRVLTSDVPTEDVAAADEQALNTLRAKGVRVQPVARGSHWLEADCSNAVGPVDLRLLLPVSKQLIGLRLDHTGIGDSALAVVGQCTALRVLNLVGTQVTAAGVEGLRELPKLRALYLYKTKVGSGDWAVLKKAFPKVAIDSGGYSLPALESDTAVVRAKPAK
jgi:hypothetical protein